jgi:hypothetical protein
VAGTETKHNEKGDTMSRRKTSLSKALADVETKTKEAQSIREFLLSAVNMEQAVASVDSALEMLAKTREFLQKYDTSATPPKTRKPRMIKARTIPSVVGEQAGDR